MVTKHKLQKKLKNTQDKQGEDRETPPEAPRIVFLLNCSSSDREIMNEEDNIYRESFHLNLG